MLPHVYPPTCMAVWQYNVCSMSSYVLEATNPLMVAEGHTLYLGEVLYSIGREGGCCVMIATITLLVGDPPSLFFPATSVCLCIKHCLGFDEA